MSNLWLNPALRRQTAEAERFPDSGVRAPDSATHEQHCFDPERLARRELRASARQFCLRLVAVALLGGSAAFSYVAWSDEVRAGFARGLAAAAFESARDGAGDREMPAAQVSELRRENAALRERIVQLERALATAIDRR